jgi:plasmid stabilization system protein ParE
MTLLPVVWLPEAETDLRAAKSWYDDLRSALGGQFVSAVGATVESISKSPRRLPTVYRSRRRARVRRFPHGIIFEVQEQRIVVIAYFHFKRNPKLWQVR